MSTTPASLLESERWATLRVRLSLALVSLATIALELALMRALSLRFWSHFAYMVISVGLLGFGASGTALTLLGRFVRGRVNTWMAVGGLGLAITLPLALLAVEYVPLDVQFLAWDRGQILGVAAVEVLLFVPFLFAGVTITAALMDQPRRITGHYAANLFGSGAGAVLAVAVMYVVSVGELLAVCSATAFAGGAILVPWRKPKAALLTLLLGAALAVMLLGRSYEPTMSPYKTVPQTLTMPETRVIHQSDGPLGRLDALAGPAIHYAPGLSLQYFDELPPQTLLIGDGDQVSPVYHVATRDGWAFMDQTTAAAAYAVRPATSACIIGAGGGSQIGLAYYHGCPRIVAMELNPRVIAAMHGPLADRGGNVYDAPGVEILCTEARGFFQTTPEKFNVIQLPPLDAFGAGGAGLLATREAYLYTVESLGCMFDRLTDRGLLCITRWARTPPRDELRIFDTAAEMLRLRRRNPAEHLAMIRNWATVTVLISPPTFSSADEQALIKFCDARSFDVAYLPGASPPGNQFHVLDRPYYSEAALALLGPGREAFLREYLFDVAATTDDRPYFFHTFRRRSWPELQKQLHARSRAFTEIGYLMLLGALIQTVTLSVILVVLPLTPRITQLRAVKRKTLTLGYFLLLGAAFMLLEMACLQAFILYLSHPIYSAAVVIAAFLVFAGLGSLLSGRWRLGEGRIILVAAGATLLMGLLYAWWLRDWLALTQSAPLLWRMIIAALTIAPPALAMGHMLPTGMRLVARNSAALVPWAWAVNGFASVAATVAAPLLAMALGFSAVACLAVGGYALAGILGGRLAR